MTLRNGLLMVLGLSLMVAVLRVVSTPEKGASRMIPDRYCGVWVSSDQNYSDRYLELRKNSVRFGTGGVSSRRYSVEGFDREADDQGRDLCRIFLHDVDGSRFSREFVVTAGSPPTLFFTNQPDVIWILS